MKKKTRVDVAVWKRLFKSLLSYDDVVLHASDNTLSFRAHAEHGCIFAELRVDGEPLSDMLFSVRPKQLYDRLALFGEDSKIDLCWTGLSLYFTSELSTSSFVRYRICEAKADVLVLRQRLLPFEVNLNVDSMVLKVIDNALFLGYAELRLTVISDMLTLSFGDEDDICYMSEQPTGLCEVNITVCARRMRDALALSTCDSVMLSLGIGLPVVVCHSSSLLSAAVYVAPSASNPRGVK